MHPACGTWQMLAAFMPRVKANGYKMCEYTVVLAGYPD
jgi:hypothetical protein